MATVTGLTAAKMKEIYDASITDARLSDTGDLILTTEGGQDINVGNLRGPKGDQGAPGAITKVAGKGDDGTGNIPLTAADLGAASSADIANAIPTGTIWLTGRSAAPSGWVLCQGQAVSRTSATYSALFAAINTAFGAGDGTTTFNVPDLRGRVPVGRDTSQTGFDTIGEKGGANSVALTVAQMPAHKHGINGNSTRMTKTQPAWKSGAPSSTGSNGGKSVASGWDSGRYGDDVQISGDTYEEGDGAAHNNLQPYQVVNYMIKL